ncbi:type II CRISPR RNA-guided endonuclease Cas9 [Roseibacillus ishigakijimensis]|uniref:CRISPR-associated endonuclease Cas9 n=1 Tax=Roseibacillus ishigakijimensis TaxID=454146 RepID=A0A934RV83_9BACT|nr:type II CRISPR RNA-guided endonuclease Cas9 [Roseibacillus ishigakijimensis]MBK1835629.1 type II CRISPR RNA-guided endonuclease Cas9 [Roseibacillus ishigakijimensis]
MKNYVIGLDMGVASIGWACLSKEDKEIDSGVRIFPAGIDKFGTGKDTHLNQKRRKARTARRRASRKSKRKQLIRQLLTELGWIPTTAKELQQWENLDVYELRHRALSEKITLPELARIILHLNQRRGFLSLRKSEVDAAEGDDKKKLEGMLGAISRLQDEIDSANHQTLGNHLYHLRAREGGEHGNIIRLRARHIRRSMLHHEFSLIWETQAKHHPELSDALRFGTHGQQDNPTAVTKPVKRDKSLSLLEQFGLENLTFFQRRVYWPIGSIGHCELEKDELRAPIADRRFQEFRMLQELNNLRLLDQSTPRKPTERKLSSEERKVAIDYLSTTQKPSLKGLKKRIAKLPDSPEEKQITFNLEADKRDNIGGLATENKLAKSLGTSLWNSLDEDEKNRIVEILTLPESESKKVIQRTDEETRNLLEHVPGLNEKAMESLLRISLPTGYCALSVKALEKLLPFMREGKLYQGKKGEDEHSARHLAGYPRRDEFASKTFKHLPLLDQLTNPNDTTHYDQHFPHVNNPLVLRSLHELRKVVNGIIRKHGKPAAIHLEMARDLKMSGKQRDDYIKKNNQHKKERDEAAKELTKYGVAPTRDAITLYRLWLEQNKTCIYSGAPISVHQLLGGDVDIDHIYPRRANDNSYMNKVVCFSEQNRQKGDRLPLEWLGQESSEFEELTQRAQHLPYPKRKRLLAEKIPEGFADRDAVDTAYMTRVARHYLTLLFAKEHHVFCTKGKHTALLRKQWELNDLLRHDLLDLKNRDDHRHHALDAIVIAACDRSLLQKVSKQLKYESRWLDKEDEKSVKPIRIYHLKPTLENLPAPWQTFRLDAAASLNAIWVSHRPKRKVSGPLHEETNYGSTEKPGILVRRKKLCDLTEGETAKIRDLSVAQAVQQYLEQEKVLYQADFGKKLPKELEQHFQLKETLTKSGIDQLNLGDDGPGRKLRADLLKKLENKNPLQDAELGKVTLPSGIPIKKVRLLIPNKAAIPLRPNQNENELIIPGNTHHIVIFSLGNGKSHFQPVTLFEATRRKRNHQPIFDKTPPPEHPEAEFLFYLCTGDSMMATIDDKDELFKYSTMPSTTKQAKFILHTDARDSRDVKFYTCKPGTFEKNFPNARKVTILPNGEIRECN